MKLDDAETLVTTIQRQSPLFQTRIIAMIGRGGHAVQITHRRHRLIQVVTSVDEWQSVYEMWTEVLDKESA